MLSFDFSPTNQISLVDYLEVEVLRSSGHGPNFYFVAHCTQDASHMDESHTNATHTDALRTDASLTDTSLMDTWLTDASHTNV